MKAKKVIQVIAMLLCVMMVMTACAGAGTKTVALTTLTVDQLAEGAKKEGTVQSVGMPDSWANWGETWSELKTTYGIDHADLDMSSAEEIAMFEAEQSKPTKDIGDIGAAMCSVAVEKGVTQPYKTAYWDKIPDWAKDADGNWIIGYYGTIVFLVNDKLVANPPKSWADVMSGDYKITVGDVVKAAQAQAAIASAAIANGGGIDNIQPGVDYFKTLAEAGRIDKGDFTLARLQKGEIAVALAWDYNALGYRDQCTAADPTMSFSAFVPSDGSVQLGYATIINKWAPHPQAAALAREYILSDEGQINLAKGYASPIRSDVEIPADVLAKLIPRDQYANAKPITDFPTWTASVTQLGQLWQDEVVPAMK